MAIIRLAFPFVSIGGPVGSMTFMKHPHSQYYMKLAHPGTGRSKRYPRQQVPLNTWSRLNKLWKTLTPEQQATFGTISSRFKKPFQDEKFCFQSIIGVIKTSRVSKNNFIAMNTRMIVAGFEPILTAPKSATSKMQVSLLHAVWNSVTKKITITWDTSQAPLSGSKIQIWVKDLKKTFQKQILANVIYANGSYTMSGITLPSGSVLSLSKFRWRMTFQIRLVQPNGQVSNATRVAGVNN